MLQTPLQQALVLIVILLNAYCFGANCVERFVNDRTWHLISAEAIKTYHRAQQPPILAWVAAPMALGFVLQTWLERNRNGCALASEVQRRRSLGSRRLERRGFGL